MFEFGSFGSPHSLPRPSTPASVAAGRRRVLSITFSAWALWWSVALPARATPIADSLTFNLVEHPTKNKNVFGTQFDGAFVAEVADPQPGDPNYTKAAWGSNYMLYKIKMSSNPSFSFSSLYAQVIANRGNQNTNPSNPLRIALFNEDPLPFIDLPSEFYYGGLTDQYALAKTSINQSAVSPTFTEYLIGPGMAGSSGIPVGTEMTYFLMVYAAGSVANQGYGLKIDPDVPQLQYYAPQDPDLTVDVWNGTGYAPAQTFVPVPEPGLFAPALVGAAAAVISLQRRRLHRWRGR